MIESTSGLQVCVLASGSKGNAAYVSDGTTSILIDAGMSGRELERRMQSRGLKIERLAGIVVSHEHNDHIQGAGVLSRRYGLPVFINSGTWQSADSRLGKLHKRIGFECGAAFRIDTLDIHPFSISHDCADPAGFTIAGKGLKVGIATDMGIVTSMVKTHLKQCSLLVLEANHDPDMLLNGPYPWPLKQRIKGRTGHLSNRDSRMLLNEILHDRLEHVVLAHLSEHNNTPEKAMNEVGQALASSDHCRAKLSVALQNVCGEVLNVRGG